MENCNKEIFENGEPVAALDAKSEAAEKWIMAVAKEADAHVDWHYSGGIAQVLYLGNSEGRARVDKAIDNLTNSLDGRILRRYNSGDSGLYRKGVTRTPKGAIAGFLNPLTGEQDYIIE